MYCQAPKNLKSFWIEIMVELKLKYKKYPAYKDSGVEWLGEIPKGWKAVRLKFLFRDVSLKNKPEKELLSVTQDKGVVPRTWVENRMVMPSGNLESFKYIQKGDFAISLRSFEGGLEYCHHDGIISPAYTVLKKKPSLIDGYYKYLFKSLSFISEIQTSVVGIREGKNISYPELSYSLLPIPRTTEQTAIANFLDDKTEKIDRAIANKQKLIELLKERKQIIIQNAVTKGLNPNVKMKDSEVEWIDKIPEHWEVKRLGVLGDFSKGGGFSKADLIANGENAILYGDIYTKYNFQITNSVRFISKKTAEESVRINCGDILFTGSGETIEDIGKCVVYNNDKRAFAGGDVIIFRQKSNYSMFISYFMNTEIAKTERAKTAKGEIIVHTYASKLKEIKTPIPSLEEQTAIVQYIETQSAKIDKAISLQENQIEKLKEYKAVLIDSTVTGKIKVSEE